MLPKLLAISLAATSLALVAGPTAARADDLVHEPGTVVLGLQGSVLFTDAASQTFASVGGVETASSGSVALASTGTWGWLDKQRAGIGKDHRIYPLDVTNRVVGQAMDVDCNGPVHLTVSPDDSKLAMYCSSDHAVLIADSTSGATVFKPSYASGTDDGVSDLAWSPDGQTLWTAGPAGLGGINATTGAVSATPTGKRTGGISVLPDGRIITVQTPDSAGGPAQVLLGTPGSTPASLQTLSKHTINANDLTWQSGLAVSPDGERLWVQTDAVSIEAVDISAIRTLADGTALPESGAVALIPPGAGRSISGFTLDSRGTTMYAGLRNTSTHVTTLEVLDVRGSGNAVFLGSQDLGDDDTSAAPVETHPAAPDGLSLSYTGGSSNTDPVITVSGQVHTAGSPSYTVDFGDGTHAGPTTQTSFPHHYATTGGHPVTLTVTDELGQSAPGVGASYWDGHHFYLQSAATARIVRNVYTYASSGLTLSVDRTTVPLGSTVSLSGVFSYSGGGQVTTASNKIYLTQSDLTHGGSKDLATGSLAPGGASPQSFGPISSAILDRAGTYEFRAQYEQQDSTIVDTMSEPVDVTVLAADSAVTASTDKTEYEAGSSVVVSSGISGSCTNGTYSVIVDGNVKKVADNTGFGNVLAPVTLAGLPSGSHAIKVTWVPSAGDDSCTASASPVRTVKLGTSPTTTTVAVPASSRPGVVPVTVTVASPGGVPTSGSVALTVDGAAAGTLAITPTGVEAFTPTLSGFGSHTIGASFAHTGVGWTGSTATAASVLVDDVPGAVTVKGTAPKPGRLQVQVVPADAHGSAVTGYTVSCSRAGSPTGTASGPGPVIEVSGLLNNADYLCSARATNAVGSGPVGAAVKGRPGKLPTTTLKVSHTKVAKNSKLSLDGTVTAANQAQVGRTVTLTFRPSSSKKRTTVKTTRTDSKGRFHFTVKATKSGAYQATAPVGPALAQDKEVFVTVKSKYHRFA